MKEYQEWLQSPCISLGESSVSIGGGDVFSTAPETSKLMERPGKRLSESPCADTVKGIMAPAVERLKAFAEQEGVAYEYVVSLLIPEKPKRPNIKCSVQIKSSSMLGSLREDG